MSSRKPSLFERLSGAFARSVLTAVAESRAGVVPNSTAKRPAKGPGDPVQYDISEPTSNALTRGVRVVVQSMYLPDQSSPEQNHYAFAYTVAIANEGDVPVQLKTRHWIITDGNGEVREVKGPGVVGKQPHLQPGESFAYTSGSVLPTPVGTMHGTYQMFLDDGTQFDAKIAPFTLAWPLFGRTRNVN